MIKVLIDDKEVDLGDAQMQVDYSIAKIGEIEKRSGARSTELNLPKTVNNRAIFENPDDVTSLSVKPYRRLKARLYVDGIDQRILFCSLESVNETYNVRLYGENVSFYTAIKDKQLQSLDLKEYDHFYTFNNVVNLRSSTDLVVYPVIDYFADSPNFYMDNVLSKAFTNYLYPAVYVEDLIEKIVNDAGYTLQNDIPTLSGYPTGLIIPYSSVPFERNKDMGRYNGKINTSAPLPLSNVIFQILFDTPDASYEYKYWGDITLDNGDFKFADTVRTDVTVNLTVTNTTVNTLNLYVDSFLANYVYAIGANQTVNISWSQNGVLMNMIAPNIDVNTSAVLLGSLVIDSASITFSNTELVEEKPEIQYGEIPEAFITLNSTLPKWKQSQVILNYLKMFCGLISVNEDTKTVRLFPFNKIANNVNKAKDWSGKIDLSEDNIVEFKNEYFQLNTLEYKGDETVEKPFGTDYQIIIDDENLDSVGEMISLDFAASEQVERLNNKLLNRIKIWSNVGSDQVESNKVKERILCLRYENFAFDYTDGGNNINVNSNIPLTHFIDLTNTLNLANIGFSNSLNVFYNPFEQVLDKSKIVTVKLKLTASDINQLDFLKPVFIKHFNAWFYISQIKGYNPVENDLTDVELVKLF